MTATPLNQAQLEVLKLMVSIPNTAEEIADLKKMLLKYLYQRAMKITAKVDKEKGYTQDTFQEWSQEHLRRKTDNSEK
jgi:hypothetical protein